MDEKDIVSGLSEEERARLEKIEKLDSNSTRKKFIFAGVTVFLIALFVLGTVFGAKYILSYEGSQPLPAAEFPDTDLSDKELIESIGLLTEANEDYASVKLDRRDHVSIPSESISVTSSVGSSDQMLGFIRESIENKIGGLYSAEDHSGAFGEDFSEFLPVFDFTEDQLKSAACEVNEENASELIVSFVFDGSDLKDLSSAAAYRVFDLEEVEEKIGGIEALFASDLTCTGKEVRYGDFTVTAFISRSLKNGEETRVLNRLAYTRNCHVEADIEFTGELAEFGAQHIAFDMNVTEDYSFTHVLFDIGKDEYFIEKGNSDEINRRIVSDQNVQEIHIDWNSSDPDIVSVDEKGFFKGKHVSDKPVTVTGTYTYNGKEFIDECLFYVRVPVESVKLSSGSLVLAKGEEAALEAVVSPEKATFKDVYYFSTDENVATFENGVVKAIAPGEASVYVITFDGNFKKSCTVTVTE